MLGQKGAGPVCPRPGAHRRGRHAAARKNFISLKPAGQAELLRALDATSAPFTKADHDFFIQLKSLTLFAYYTSEAGATLELNYVPVPGGFKGNVASATVGRRWAL
ncbi:gluconate 2-dehydrogenase subunit 3 family protein [Massilia glaciei]|uniref:Gluconate 2-dehydrogenase subunit 3 family protein n=1 Tax=Massilia glaciei TaxID=1524097 RepID=A0A2U2H8V0_9BURK|nr:gluconate 2-dehydrogenase subunit 3 family protein [Massilia glaciei]